MATLQKMAAQYLLQFRGRRSSSRLRCQRVQEKNAANRGSSSAAGEQCSAKLTHGSALTPPLLQCINRRAPLTPPPPPPPPPPRRQVATRSHNAGSKSRHCAKNPSSCTVVTVGCRGPHGSVTPTTEFKSTRVYSERDGGGGKQEVQREIIL